MPSTEYRPDVSRSRVYVYKLNGFTPVHQSRTLHRPPARGGISPRGRTPGRYIVGCQIGVASPNKKFPPRLARAKPASALPPPPLINHGSATGVGNMRCNDLNKLLISCLCTGTTLKDELVSCPPREFWQEVCTGA